MKDLLLEVKIESLGIDDPVFISLFKEYPHLTKEEKRAIIEAYLKVKRKKRKS